MADIDEDSAHELGVFHAASNLQAEGLLYAHEEELYDTVRTWFDQHLEKPTRFTAAKSPFTHKQKKAISWFKDSADEHLAQVRELVAILQNHNIPVLLLKATRVGYIVYEDEYQIVAEPFADTQR